MKKPDRQTISLWGRRLLVYVLGLYIMAIGVVFSARSSLGVSPVILEPDILACEEVAANPPDCASTARDRSSEPSAGGPCRTATGSSWTGPTPVTTPLTAPACGP